MRAILLWLQPARPPAWHRSATGISEITHRWVTAPNALRHSLTKVHHFYYKRLKMARNFAVFKPLWNFGGRSVRRLNGKQKWHYTRMTKIRSASAKKGGLYNANDSRCQSKWQKRKLTIIITKLMRTVNTRQTSMTLKVCPTFSMSVKLGIKSVSSATVHKHSVASGVKTKAKH